MPLPTAILYAVRSAGYAVNKMVMLTTPRRYRFAAWPADANPGGVYRGGEQHVAEADSEYEAGVELAGMVGVELEDG